MRCPRCGSEHVICQSTQETTTSSKTKGFGCIKACLGYLIFSIPGILCGLCGMGKGKTKTTTTTRMINICQNCGNRW
ncbi:MAG: hypothetical protein K2N01_06820 [Lachnospiraceae bacterium]|nr:hypothetical protein [Lachnospiraceae bacterium]